MRHFIESIQKMKRDLDPTKLMLFTDSNELMEELCEDIDDIPILISTDNPPMSSMLQREHVDVRHMKHPPEVGINVLRQAKDVILTYMAEGLLDKEDRVLFVISTDIETILSFDVKEVGVANLKSEVEGRVDIKTVEAAFNIGSKIAREGKEGLPAGALLILGDTNMVLRHTQESIKNPLQGYSREELNIKDEDNWKTLKEFSMMDGALVVDEDGFPVAAGRYVMFESSLDASVENGFGGRHLAAASITQNTDSIAMVVSSEGPIRAYKDGEMIYEIDTL